MLQQHERSDMPVPPPPPGLEEIQRQEQSRLFARLVGARLFFAPIFMAIAVGVAFVDEALWRRLLLVATAAAFGGFFVSEWLRFRRHGIDRLSITVNLAAMVVGQALVIFGTGGLTSPLLFVMVPVGVLLGVLVAPPALFFLVGGQIAAVWLFAALGITGAVPDLALRVFGGGPHGFASEGWLWTAAAVLTLVLVLGAAMARAVRLLFDAMLRRALVAQDESLRAHRERAEELGALSAEIAHELKNPLASVKGLGGLLAPEVAGKAAERLAVLRREVDRMQSILDEFLNFSRPLVPLALGRVDLAALSQEVAALHEGLAQERGLSLEVRGGGAARCDPRKVKQVLINLLQNAIEASPAGGAVEIELREVAGDARVRVLDRGAGPDPSLGERVFEPGVTTKPRGSGIGLTVARALARQHGGEMALSARPGGGCAAELRLPAAGEATPAAGIAAPARAAGEGR